MKKNINANIPFIYIKCCLVTEIQSTAKFKHYTPPSPMSDVLHFIVEKPAYKYNKYLIPVMKYFIPFPFK